MRKTLVGVLVGLVVAGTIGLHLAAQTTPTPATISLQERVLMASRIYRVISTYFPEISQEKFDGEYAEYLSRILRSEDRREFDLASMEFVANLHDGHSWFYDNWLEQNYGQPIGFIAYPLDGRWTVIRSRLAAVHVGDVITAVDGVPIPQYFERNRRYVSASSHRDAGLSFFDTPAIFPQQFKITLADGRAVAIDRKNDKKAEEPPAKTEGRWLTPSVVAYIKLPVFHGIETQAQAIDFLKQFHDAKTLILDIRGNPGLGDPKPLQQALMTQPYQSWTEASAMTGGVMLRNYSLGSTGHTEMTITEAVVRPREPVYTGRLILLTDRQCSCACEDFTMPFKTAKRAELVGETTAGTFSFTNFTAFDNGMLLNIASVRHKFPDGSRFEGVGIRPDVAVATTPEDLQAGRDPVLKKAMEMANAK